MSEHAQIILKELVIFQKEYEENTRDKCPGNKYYADKLMVIVTKAKTEIECGWVEFAMFRGENGWDTNCGETYNYDGHHPKNYGVKYCQHCGKVILFHPLKKEKK